MILHRMINLPLGPNWWLRRRPSTDARRSEPGRQARGAAVVPVLVVDAVVAARDAQVSQRAGRDAEVVDDLEQQHGLEVDRQPREARAAGAGVEVGDAGAAPEGDAGSDGEDGAQTGIDVVEPRV